MNIYQIQKFSAACIFNTALSLFTLLFTYSFAPPCEAYAQSSQREMAVLVHGANFTSGSWLGVQHILAKYGIYSFAPQLYTSAKREDLHQVSQHLCQFIQKIGRPVTLVGHSQGGAIVTEAAGHCGNQVKKLIYVTAVFPKSGEGTFADLSQADGDNYGKCGALDENTHIYGFKSFEGCWKTFMADSSRVLAEKFYTTVMTPEPDAIGNSTASYSETMVNPISKYYIQTKMDLIISPETQNKIIRKTHFRGVFSLNSSHTPFLSKPQELSVLIGRIILTP